MSKAASLAVLVLALTAASIPADALSASDRAAAGSANLAYASFRSVELGVDAPAISAKATDAFHRAGHEHDTYTNCDRDTTACPPKVHSWRAEIERMNGHSGLVLLAAVNASVNKLITYRDDPTAYGKVDHWATPMESLAGYGDCEDYALVKYLSLVELGIPHDRMRIVILKDNARNIGHAVLAVTLNELTYILDNVTAHPVLDSSLPHYRPIYSFNQSQQWLNVAVRSREAQVAAIDATPTEVAVIPPAANDGTGAAIQ